MTEHEKIENLLRTAKFGSKSEVNKAVFENLLNHWDKDNLNISEKQSLGRKIMNSRFSKLTAATVAIILVLTGILYLGDNHQGVALGAVIESMQKMNWIHAKGTVQRAEQTLEHEEWECFNPKIKIKIEPDGVINYRDYDNEVAYVYQPSSNTVTISSTTDRFNQTSPESPSEIVQFMVEQFESQGGEISRKRATMNQVSVEIINMVNEYQDLTLIVDLERYLPINIDTVVHIPETNQKVTASVVLDYPQQGPMDIFSLGIPADAQIIDNRPEGSTQNLINEIQKRFDASFEDHIAVVLESYVEDNNTLEPAQIIVMRQNGILKRLDRYHAFNFRGTRDISSLYTVIKDAWSELTIQNVIDLEDDKYAEYQLVFDGVTSNQRTNFSGEERTDLLRSDMFQLGSIETLTSFAWCNPSALMMTGSDRQVKPEIIPEDPDHAGQVGLCLIETMNDSSVRLPGNTIKEKNTTYWFDPAKDYLLIESTAISVRDEGISKSIQKTIETAQTESGKWYPAIIISDFSSPGANGQIHRTIRQIRIMVDTNPVFKEGIFNQVELPK